MYANTIIKINFKIFLFLIPDIFFDVNTKYWRQNQRKPNFLNIGTRL